MLKKSYLVISVFASLCLPASAGFDSWSVEKQADPFSGGEKILVDYRSSPTSGVIVICDTSERGLLVRSVPGFAHQPILDDITPTLAVAFDGEKLLSEEGRTGTVGDNLAVSQVMLGLESAQKFVYAFAKAKRQIAIQDGISDTPQLLKATGSTVAGEALVECMTKQTKQ